MIFFIFKVILLYLVTANSIILKYKNIVMLSPQKINQQKLLLKHSNVIIYKTDSNGIITYVNTYFKKVNDYSTNEVLGKYHGFLRHADTPSCITKSISDSLDVGKSCFAVIKNFTKNNIPYWTLAYYEVNLHDNSFFPTYTVKKVRLANNVKPHFEELYEKMKKIDSNSGNEVCSKYFNGLLEYYKIESYQDFIFKTINIDKKTLIKFFNKEVAKNNLSKKRTKQSLNNNMFEIEMIVNQIKNLT